jgi:hypothetical protein
MFELFHIFKGFISYNLNYEFSLHFGGKTNIYFIFFCVFLCGIYVLTHCINTVCVEQELMQCYIQFISFLVLLDLSHGVF